MQTNLKPCPFCGSVNIELGHTHISVICGDCDAEGSVGDADMDVAIESWNTRSNAVTRLTQQKADAIVAKGYAVTGYVLTSPEGKKAIVDCQAVRWLDAADNHAKYLDLVTELWAAAQLAPGEGVEDAENRMSRILEKALIPDGYALVPIEPTPEMLKSGWAENDTPLKLRWKAMINAAPKA